MYVGKDECALLSQAWGQAFEEHQDIADFALSTTDETLDNQALIEERYRGIRPAPGYPACPDHTEKAVIWELLDVQEETGIELTEHMAMWPGAAVSGLIFAHPQAQYFVVGRLGRDQVEEYAGRKGWDLRTAERWLSPNLGYHPEE